MNDNEFIHCRLCADLKPNHKLIHLITEEGHCQDIVKTLSRFNVQINLNDNNLPKMACITCVESLQQAFNFISAVERAQSTLNDLILEQQVKKEKNVSDDENFIYEGPADYEDDMENIKLVHDKTDSTLKSSLENNTENSLEEKKKRYFCTNVDTLPLSQLKMTWKDYEWLCSHCETLFPTIEELHNHSMQYHKVCNPYKCTDCKARVFRLDSFLKHLKRHRNYLKFSCYKCHMKFSNVKESSRHKAEHKETSHICSGCNENFKCREELAEHTGTYWRGSIIGLKTVDNVEELSIEGDSLTCTVCNKTYSSKKSLVAHMSLHAHRSKEHTCEICGKCFYQKPSLEEHLLQHSDARPYQCDICKLGFKTSYRLRMHIASHNGEKPFSCDQCGKCFRLKRQLSNHSVVHTDSFPHVCSYCNKGFRFKTILNQHLRQHTGDKPYSCNICQRDFTNWSNYNKHMKRRHNTDMAKKKRTPQGALPVDPVTGELIYNKVDEAKSSISDQRSRGRRQRNTAMGKRNRQKNINNNE